MRGLVLWLLLLILPTLVQATSYSGVHTDCTLVPCNSCPGSPVGGGLQWLRESTLKDGNVSVGVHPRTNDLSCYITSLWRETVGRRAAETTTRPHFLVVVYGEFHRLDVHSTIGQHMIAPYVAAGYRVSVSLTLQTSNTVKTNWHDSRFETLTQMHMTFEEKQRAVVALAQDFLRQGAEQVHAHLYALHHLPPMMPTKATGGPGRGSVVRLELMWASYDIHCLVHSIAWRDVELAEGETGAQYDLIAKTRADTFLLGDIPLVPPSPRSAAVMIKRCLNWGGYNDKFALIPRKYARPWMSLLEAYHDPSYVNYKNSEQLQKAIAERHRIPVDERVDIPAIDYYHWIRGTQGHLGCFPQRYAGVSGEECRCFSNATQCAAVKSRLCPGSV
jgi:hypothetical protein